MSKKFDMLLTFFFLIADTVYSGGRREKITFSMPYVQSVRGG